MADPLSVTSLVLQVGAIVKQLYDYGKQVKSARKDINALCSDLLALRGILEDLKDRDADPNDGGRLTAILSRAAALLSDLLQRLEPGLTWQSRAKQALKWPFDKAHIDEVLTDLERIKSALLLALMGDYHSALADMSHMRNSILAIKADMEEVKDTVTNEALVLRQQKQAEVLEKIHDRIAPVSPRSTHEKLCAVWHGTKPASWFVKGQVQPWLRDPRPKARLMALCGVSGAGKSTIISRTIEKLATDENPVPVAYFYCTFNEVATHEVRNVLGSWLVQLSQRAGTQELLGFERYVDKQNEIPIEALQEALARTADAIGPVLLILDALNESTKSDKILTAMAGLIQRSTQIRCLVSTTFAIGGVFQNLACSWERVMISSHSIQEDVISYIKRQVQTHEILKATGEDRILKAIVPRTQGMFRWAACQMNILSEHLTVKMVRKALENLPGSLDDIYVVLLQRVPPAFRDPVRDALLWLTYSLRSLTLSELTEAVVVEVGERYIDDSCRIHPKHRILELCQGLVVWDEYSRVVSLAHSSVATFLESDFIRSSPVACFALIRSEAVPSMMQRSLNYILMDEFQDGPCAPLTLVQRYRQYPLLDYASTTWAMHTFDKSYTDGTPGEIESDMVLQLFRTYRTCPNGGNITFWVQCLLPHTRASDIQAPTPLYYAASFGLTPIIAMMFERGQVDVRDPTAPWYIDKPSGRGGSTPLIVACYRGHIHVVKMLLAYGALPNLVDALGVSGRTWARVCGFRGIARLMREHGGVEQDNLGYIRDRIDSEYTVDDAADISGDDDFAMIQDLPYNGFFRHKRRAEQSSYP